MQTTVVQPTSSMLLHEFTHSGVAYQVWLYRDKGIMAATLSVVNTDLRRALLPGLGEFPNDFSPQAIRIGLIATAEWVVKAGRWSDSKMTAHPTAQELAVTAQVVQ